MSAMNELMKKHYTRTCRRVIADLVCGSLLVVSCWSLVGCDNAPGPKFSSTEMVQKLSGMQELSSKCRAADNADATECKLVREGLAKLGATNKVYYRSSQGSLIGIDFAGRVVVVLELVTGGSSGQWKCSVSPAEAVPTACGVLQ